MKPVIIARLIIRQAGADSRLAATRAPRFSAVPSAAAIRTAIDSPNGWGGLLQMFVDRVEGR